MSVGAPGTVSHMAATTGAQRNQEGGLERARREYETTNETKSGFRTSEFIASAVAAIGVLLAALIQDEFNAEEAWRLVTYLAIGYMISRGIAKAGVSRHGGGGGTRL
jgi:hypothetical protein